MRAYDVHARRERRGLLGVPASDLPGCTNESSAVARRTLPLVTGDEQDAVEQHFGIGFRELYVRDIVHADLGDVRMGTFVLCAAFLDALALTFSAGLRVKGKPGEAKWAQFIERYFGEDYAFLRPAYDGFRNKLLHNYSARGIIFTHGPDQAHLHLRRESNGVTWMHRESFVRDVIAAFDAFEQDVRSSSELRGRVLAHLKVFPPMGVSVFDVPSAPRELR